MSFINSSIDITSLPAAEAITLKPVDHSYLKLLRIEWLITSAFLSVVVVAVIVFIPGVQISFWWWVLVVASLLIILPYYFLQEKSFPYKSFAVREHDVIYQKGWLVRTTKICPFNRIQNCSIGSGPLERKFQLASLTLYTAGAEGADMRIPGLRVDEAEQLRQYILSRINEANSAG
jgi:membrane protein YdbS with pleckstrin-like domain